jgi:hypothetical protein
VIQRLVRIQLLRALSLLRLHKAGSEEVYYTNIRTSRIADRFAIATNWNNFHNACSKKAHSDTSNWVGRLYVVLLHTRSSLKFAHAGAQKILSAAWHDDCSMSRVRRAFDR